MSTLFQSPHNPYSQRLSEIITNRLLNRLWIAVYLKWYVMSARITVFVLVPTMLFLLVGIIDKPRMPPISAISAQPVSLHPRPIYQHVMPAGCLWEILSFHPNGNSSFGTLGTSIKFPESPFGADVSEDFLLGKSSSTC